MIQMYHVDLRYTGGTYGLRDISLTLERGEFVFLTGSSGAGKTSLLRLLFGAEQPSAGQILVSGRNITRMKAAQVPALRRQIGVIFQDFKLLPERTVFENVAIALEIAGTAKREIRTRVWTLLKRLGLGHRIDHRPRTLSAGAGLRPADRGCRRRLTAGTRPLRDHVLHPHGCRSAGVPRRRRSVQRCTSRRTRRPTAFRQRHVRRARRGTADLRWRTT